MPEVTGSVPASDWVLGEVGKRSATLLASRLNGLSPELIWSSNEPKAVQTAKMWRSRLGFELRILDGLKEHHRENVPLISKEQFSAKMEDFFSYPDQLVLGTETALQRGRKSATKAGILTPLLPSPQQVRLLPLPFPLWTTGPKWTPTPTVSSGSQVW